MYLLLFLFFDNSFSPFWAETNHFEKCLHFHPQMYKMATLPLMAEGKKLMEM